MGKLGILLWFACFCMARFCKLIFLIFLAMVATSLVNLAATLDPRHDPPCLFGWWNLWWDARAVCKGSPSLGCFLVLWGTNFLLLVLMMLFQAVLRSANILFFKEGNGVLNKRFLLVIISSRMPHFLQRQEIFIQRLLTFLDEILMVNYNRFSQMMSICWPQKIFQWSRGPLLYTWAHFDTFGLEIWSKSRQRL